MAYIVLPLNLSLPDEVVHWVRKLLNSTNVAFFPYSLVLRNLLAYYLADNGYDVWLANARGNEFSKNHKYLSTNSTPYWNFSFHEMAKYDLPAIIDYILMVTNQSALHLVGKLM